MDQNSPHVGIGAADVTELQRLEEPLWRAETRFDNSYMDAVLAGDFTEFGRSGRTYSRLDILGATGPEIDSRLPLAGFTARQIVTSTVLVTYVGEVTYEVPGRADRSSIWSRTPAGWKLRFHQGTPTT